MIEEKELIYNQDKKYKHAKMTMKITIQVGISMYKGGGDTKPLDDIKLFNESLAIIKNISVSPGFKTLTTLFFLEKYLRHIFETFTFTKILTLFFLLFLWCPSCFLSVTEHKNYRLKHR